MKGWETVSLGSLVKFISGGTPNKGEEKYWGGGIPWVSSGEMITQRIWSTSLTLTSDGVKEGSKLVPKNTIFLVVRGMSLAKEFRVSIAMKEMSFNQDVKAIKPIRSINEWFLFYYFLSQKNTIRDSASEAAHGTKKIDMPVLEQLLISLPPLPIQKKIAAILSAYDDLIETNNRRISILEKMAEELYKEWFVRLRFPGHEKTKIKNGIPEGWEVKLLSNLLEDIIDYRGITPLKLKSSWVEDGIIALSALNIKNGKLVKLEDSKKVDYNLYQKWMKKELQFLDILLTSEAPLGELYIIMNNDKYVLSQRLFAIRANKEKINPMFLYYYLRSEKGQHHLKSKGTGSTVSGIRQSLLREIEILCPPLSIQEKFKDFIFPCLSNISIYQSTISNLTFTRDRLLSRLLSGKIDVENLDIKFPDSMKEDS